MNHEQYFDVSETPHLVVRTVHNSLSVRVWDEPRVWVSGENTRYGFRQEGAQIIVDEVDDCRIQVPHDTRVTVEVIHGNAVVEGTRGEVAIQRAHGNLKLSEVGGVQLGPIGSSLTADEVAGDLAAQRVAGNVTLSAIHGQVLLGDVSGNCRLREGSDLRVDRVRGNLHVREGGNVTATRVDGDFVGHALAGDVMVGQVGGTAGVVDVAGEVICEAVGGDLRVHGQGRSVVGRAGGGARLRLGPDAPQRIQVTAGGSIRCHIPTSTQAQVKLHSGGGLQVRDLPVTEEWNRHRAEFVLGAGEGRIDLTAGGGIRLIGDDDATSVDELDIDIDVQMQQELGERAGELLHQVSEQVEVQVENLARRLDERLARMGTGEEIAAKVQQKIQVAVRRAEEKLAEADATDGATGHARGISPRTAPRAACADRAGYLGAPCPADSSGSAASQAQPTQRRRAHADLAHVGTG